MDLSFLKSIFKSDGKIKETLKNPGREEVKTFRGGCHPNDMKAMTNKKAIVDIEAPQELIYPLNQHIGAPSEPVVKVGDSVYVGQKIAKGTGFVSANIHASVSGTVKAIEDRLTPSGSYQKSIIIENDGEDTNGFDNDPRDFKAFTASELVDMIKEAGIVGMGGAAFPTHVKLSPPKGKKIEYIIINGAECEPYLTSDHRAMLETPMEIITGLDILMRIFSLPVGYIGIESNKPDAIKMMKKCAKNSRSGRIEIVPLKTKYPQGAEKQLIYAVSGRTVPRGGLPMDVGAIVQNIDTCASIARAVVYEMPLISRIVTVTGDCVKNPTNVRVRIGTPFGYIIEKTGGLRAHPKKVIMGGPMMGIAVPSLDVPVIKGTSAILTFGKRLAAAKYGGVKYGEIRNSETKIGKAENGGVTNGGAESVKAKGGGVCIRCGKCVSACPMHLMPLYLKEAARLNDFERLKTLGVQDCIECGSCSFVCPGRNNPSDSIKIAKVRLKNNG